MRMITLWVLLVVCLALVGCVSSSATLEFRAIEPVNPGEQGESRITDIRIYQLKDDSKFREADIRDLWSNDKEYLGDTLIGEPMTGISIFPEEREGAQGKQVVVEPIETGTRFIGVLALYSQDDEVSRRFIAVPLAEAESVVFEFSGYHISTVAKD